MPQLQQTLEAIDHLNAEDPNVDLVEGVEYPREKLYSQRMLAQMEAFCGEASDELKIAAYAQHVQRWASPRSDFPQGKAGYYRWRTELGRMHARLTAEVMAEAGYDENSQTTVKRLLTKQGIKLNADVQILEDVICLVFMQFYFLPFADKHEEPKVIDIVQKTWAKMSAEGQQAALKLPLEQRAKNLVAKALQ